MEPADNDKKIAEIISQCWKDDSFKQKFISNPKKVLSEKGIDVPADLKIKVVENTDRELYITLPPNPAKLSDSQLEGVTGGAFSSGGTVSGAGSALGVSGAFLRVTQSAQNGSTCYKDCIPW